MIDNHSFDLSHETFAPFLVPCSSHHIMHSAVRKRTGVVHFYRGGTMLFLGVASLALGAELRLGRRVSELVRGVGILSKELNTEAKFS